MGKLRLAISPRARHFQRLQGTGVTASVAGPRGSRA